MKEAYTIQEIANLLNCSIAVIYSYERRGYIKRIADDEGKFGSAKFGKEEVERLVATKRELDTVGNSFSDLAKKMGVHPGRIKEAVDTLNLNVKKVQISMYSTRKRYALTNEQEQEIIKYLNQDKTMRPKRNYLYYSHIGLAQFQGFLLNDTQEIRLVEGPNGRIGFYLAKDHFLSYNQALENYKLTPMYSIHKPQIEKNNNNFTDLIIPINKEDFLVILDALYRICGIENFNAEISNSKLFASIRNGTYSANSEHLNETIKLLNQYLVFGEVKDSGNNITFTRPQKVVEIQLDPSIYISLNEEAQKAHTSLSGWIQKLLIERERAKTNQITDFDEEEN